MVVPNRVGLRLCGPAIFDSVSPTMPFVVDSLSFRTRWMKTRFPFKYGIASMTELPHVFVTAKAEVDGKKCAGLASEGLPPKWFTKNAETTFEQDLPEMLEVIQHAADLVTGKLYPSLFEAWQELYRKQDEWAQSKGYAPLLAHLGTALVERVLIDAYCRGTELTFADAIRENTFEIDLGVIHEELAGSQPGNWLPEPAESVIARHTVGLADPLQEADIPSTEKIDDGLPHALVDAIATYELTHFKVKVCGNLEIDIPRLKELAKVLQDLAPGFRFTLDGNEQYYDVATFRTHWEAYRAESDLKEMLEGGGLLFVEQPLHRDVALNKSVQGELADWPEAPPMIIDESDGALDSLREALALGYRGTSHKNCKGVIKGVANRCLIEWYRRNRPEGGPWLMSGEDLANVGPVALLNDLAVAVVLGIEDVERNGHHYFSGLSMFPEEIQALVCERHPDLYTNTEKGFAALQIRKGKLSTESLSKAPFGHGLDLTDDVLSALGDVGLPD